MIDGLEQGVIRYGWELPCYVVMGNHLHLLVKTTRPNLGAGMQSFLSGYAIWSGRRWRRAGQLFQGRYRAEMVEDESCKPGSMICHRRHFVRLLAAGISGPPGSSLGLSRADSVPNLTRRLQARLTSQPELLNDFAEILQRATSEEADRRPKTVNNPKAKRRQGGRDTKNKV